MVDEEYDWYGIKREVYHGGDLIGINAGTLMLNASKIMKELIAEILACRKKSSATDREVKETCGQWAKLLGLLDASIASLSTAMLLLLLKRIHTIVALFHK